MDVKKILKNLEVGTVQVLPENDFEKKLKFLLTC